MANLQQLLTIFTDYLDQQIKLENANSSFYHYSDVHSAQEAPKGCVFPIRTCIETSNTDSDYNPIRYELIYQIRLMVSSTEDKPVALSQEWVQWLSEKLVDIKKDGIDSDIGIVFWGIEIEDFQYQYTENTDGGLTTIIVTKIKHCLDY